MKNRQKILALVLASTMVMGTMAGCADNQNADSTAANSTKADSTIADSTTADSDTTTDTTPQETVTIKWYRQAYNTNSESETQKVADAINEYIEPKIGVKVEMVDENNYNLSMEMAAGGDVDLFWSANWAGAYDYINSGAVMDLADLLDNYPELKASIPDNVWQVATWDEHNWYVPILKEAGSGTQISIPKDLYEKYCPDLKSITDLSELTPYLEKMKADGMTCAFDTTNLSFAAGMASTYYLNVSGDVTLLIGVDEDMKAVAYAMTPEFEQHCNTMYTWQQAGYIPDDQFENHDDANYRLNLIADGNWGFSTWTATPDGVANASARYGTDMVLIDYTPLYMTKDSPAGSLYMINANSQKADACLKFLELLYTDPVVADLACFGIEGEHYDIVDGRIQVREDAAYKYGGVWCVTNVMAPDLQVGESEDKKEQYASFNADCTISPLSDFVFDKTPVEAELTAMGAAYSEYNLLLEKGFYDPAEYLPKYQDALKAAGVEKVVAEVQAQLDAFLADK